MAGEVMRKNWVLGIAGVLIAGTLALSTPQITEASVPTVQYAVQAQYETGVLSKQNPVVMASQNGWVKSGDKYYYYKKGVKQTGWKVIKNKRYYFNKKGVMQTGWLESKNKWYYLGEDGAAVKGWKKLDDSWYYFSSKLGIMQTGWTKINKKWYYFNSKGMMVTGQKVIGGKLHNFKPNGQWTGEVDTSGSGSTSKTFQGRTYDAAKAIKFAKEHTAVDVSKGLARSQCIYGWQCAEFLSNCLKVGGMPEYSDHATILHGQLANDPMIEEIVVPLDNGYIKLENVPHGEIAAGDPILLYCPHCTDGRPFVHSLFFVGWSEDGCAKIYCHNNRNVGTVNRWPACYACHGGLTEAHVMHIRVNSPKENNTYPHNSFMHVGKETWHINSKGLKDTGLITVDGEKYLFNSKGVMQTGWQEINGGWYYFDTAGKMVKGWMKLNNKWYYLNKGKMVTGVNKIGKKTYFFNSQGVMQTGWISSDGNKYYAASDGAMVKGWKKIKGKQYYFNSDGAMRTGWLKYKSKYYYFSNKAGKKGVMLTGKVKIQGKVYKFNKSGVCTNR